MMISPLPRPYEVWRIPFAFEEDPSLIKERPVVIAGVSQDRAVALALKVTGHGPRPEYPGEVRILDWEAAGLSKPSTVRCSKQLEYPLSGFTVATRYGKLSANDAAAVKAAVESLMGRS